MSDKTKCGRDMAVFVRHLDNIAMDIEKIGSAVRKEGRGLEYEFDENEWHPHGLPGPWIKGDAERYLGELKEDLERARDSCDAPEMAKTLYDALDKWLKEKKISFPPEPNAKNTTVDIDFFRVLDTEIVRYLHDLSK